MNKILLHINCLDNITYIYNNGFYVGSLPFDKYDLNDNEIIFRLNDIINAIFTISQIDFTIEEGEQNE